MSETAEITRDQTFADVGHFQLLYQCVLLCYPCYFLKSCSMGLLKHCFIMYSSHLSMCYIDAKNKECIRIFVMLFCKLKASVAYQMNSNSCTVCLIYHWTVTCQILVIFTKTIRSCTLIFHWTVY